MQTLKIKNLLIAIALGVVFLNPVQASTTFGNSDCGEWVNKSKSTPTMRSWLIGYMSGLSVMHTLNNKNDDPLDKINSVQQIYVWMDNYCQNNPLKSVMYGGTTLFIELGKK